MVKWKLEPLTSGCPGYPSKPHAQSIPSSPNIGRKALTPTPAARFATKGLNWSMEYQAFPPSRKASTKIVAEGFSEIG